MNGEPQVNYYAQLMKDDSGNPIDLMFFGDFLYGKSSIEKKPICNTQFFANFKNKLSEIDKIPDLEKRMEASNAFQERYPILGKNAKATLEKMEASAMDILKTLGEIDKAVLAAKGNFYAKADSKESAQMAADARARAMAPKPAPAPQPEKTV